MPTEIWSLQLRSEAAGGEEGRRKKKGEEGRRRKKEEGRKEKRKQKVFLIKSRDPHLAGGEKCLIVIDNVCVYYRIVSIFCVFQQLLE